MEFKLHQTQAIVARDKHRFRVLCCGRRWGKTTLAIDQMKGCAVSGNNKRIAYIAPTYQQARDIAWEQLKKELQEAAESINESRLEIKLINGSLIVLRGWEAIETLRGQRFDLVVIDEVAMMRDFEMKWQEVIRPTLTDTKGEGLFISTPKGYNHFFDLFNAEKTDKDFASFHYTSYQNPFIPDEELDKAKGELTEDRFAQEYMADFRKMEGLVYKEFDRILHVTSDKPTERKERILGVDFGYTNPSVVLTIDVDENNEYWVTGEWHRTGKTNIEIIEYIKTQKANVVYPDPAEPDRIDEMNKHGIITRDVSKDIENGINKVRELFKSKKIHIDESCRNLIWELETYAYPDKKPDKNEYEAPIKENDHCVDALRYALYMHSPESTEVRTFKPNWAETRSETKIISVPKTTTYKPNW